MWDHIAKPLNVGEMFSTIAKWIKPGEVGAGRTAVTAAVSSAEPVASLPNLHGIDVKAGLATTVNNEKLYTRMLIKFRDSQGKFAELFAAARQDADPTAATRCAHTLKGTAGNIGAKGVQTAAGELEAACNEKLPEARIDELLQKTLAELAPVMDSLQKVGSGRMETATNANDAPAISAEALQAGLVRLKVLLEDSDSEAADLVEELLELTKGSPLGAPLQKVAAAIGVYDFDSALEALQVLGS
jgi:two-component system sensor histidine kinase/response regulator